MAESLSQTEALNRAHGKALAGPSPCPVWRRDRANDVYPTSWWDGYVWPGQGWEYYCSVHRDRTISYDEPG